MAMLALSGCSRAKVWPASKARWLASTSSSPFLASLLRMPFITATAPMPNQPAMSPSTTVFLARSVPAVALAMAAMGTATTCSGVTPTRGIACSGMLVAAS